MADNPLTIPSRSGSWNPGGGASFISRSRISTLACSLDGQCLETLVGVDPDDALELVPVPIRPELPGQHVVGELDLEHLREPSLEPGVGDRGECLDASIQVAGHEVGGADEVLGRGRVGTEAVDARVLEDCLLYTSPSPRD